jgi:isopentenyl-diphosphate Delta-isomerase
LSLAAIKSNYFTGKDDMTATEYVILVDKNNQEIGLEEKISAHKKNLLHRAFSVFIFRTTPQKEILLQQRALNKYHSPGLWTNTCCSHPRSGENVISAGRRRLKEELNIDTELTDLGWFYYQSSFPNGLHEHEIDHVLIGTIAADTVFEPNPEEVNAVRWVTIEQLRQEVRRSPEQFTPWLPLALEIVMKSFK